MRETRIDIEDMFLKAILAVLLAGVVVVLIIAGVAFSFALAGSNQSTRDVTSRYSIPDELAGCRVYRLVPRGFGQTLYVVSRDGTPEAVRFDEQHGKTTRPVVVVSE